MADTTMTFYFGTGASALETDGLGGPGGMLGDATLSNFRFDSDSIMVTEDDEEEDDSVDDEDESEDQLTSGEISFNKRVRMSRVSAESSASDYHSRLEEPALDANDHARFSSSLKYLVDMDLTTYLASNIAHLQVLASIERQESFRRERDTWLLLDLLKSRKMPKVDPDYPRNPDLSDRDHLNCAVAESSAAQFLVALVRWQHLCEADRSPTLEVATAKSLNLERIGDIFDESESVEVGNIVWRLVRSGALFNVVDANESQASEQILTAMLSSHRNLNWRLASLFGGKPFHAEEPVREGNAHRAIWKLTCRRLAEKTDSKNEKRVYAIAGGVDCLADSTNLNDRLWSRLRALSERWSDAVLRRYHQIHYHCIAYRSRGEADVDAERTLVESDLSMSLLDEKVLLATIRSVFQSLNTSDGKEGFFSRVQLALVSGSSIDELISNELARPGRDLRFLAHLALYLEHQDSSLAVLSLHSPSQSVRTAAVKAYVERLLEQGLVQDAALYLRYLDLGEEGEAAIARNCLVGCCLKWSDVQKTSLCVEALAPRFGASLGTLILQPVAVLEPDASVRKKQTEHAQVRNRRKEFIPAPLNEGDEWKEVWMKVELFRFSLLASDVIPIESILTSANAFVQRAAQRYLDVSEASKRIIEWKSAEAVIYEVRTFLSNSPATVSRLQNSQNYAELCMWESAFTAWKSVAALDALTETIKTKLEAYERQMGILQQQKRTIELRELERLRDADISQWTEEDISKQTTSSLFANSTALCAAFAQSLTHKARLGMALRDRIIDLLIKETFRALDSSAQLADDLRLLARLPAVSTARKSCVALSDCVALEVVRRTAVVRDEVRLAPLRTIVQEVLSLIGKASRALLEFTEHPLEYAFET